VLRGGAWANNRVNARCAYRNDNNPHNDNDNNGFRLATCAARPPEMRRDAPHAGGRGAEASEENNRPVPGRRTSAKQAPRRPLWYAPAGADAWGGALLVRQGS